MIDNNVFRDVSYGMYLVSTKNETSSGCIINTLVQITSTNPLIAISLNKNNATHNEIVKSKRFAVSVLSEETNQEVIKTFGYFSSKDINKFDNVKYEEKDNLPVVLEDISSYLICKVENIIDCETHDIFIGRVELTEKVSNKIPMTYKYYHENRKGTSPKNAPTFIEEKKKDAYRCTVCGYIYDNEKEEIPFEELPDDWVCPRCGVGKELFEKL